MRCLNVLVACEESQEVCKAFRELGHRAYSCDLEPCSGGHPEWHIQDDVTNYIYYSPYGVWFKTQAGKTNALSCWDMILAFPPCSHLTVAGAKYFPQKRADGRQRDAIEFFCKFLDANARYIAIENPVGVMSGDYVAAWYPDLCRKYGLPIKHNQIINPYQFGHPVSKKTCLWLKGLPELVPTNVVVYEKIHSAGRTGGYSGNRWYVKDGDGKILRWNDPLTAKIRSKAYPGIANAMARQWSDYIAQVESGWCKRVNTEWHMEE